MPNGTVCPHCHNQVVLHSEPKWRVRIEQDVDGLEGVDIVVSQCPNGSCRGLVFDKVWWEVNPNIEPDAIWEHGTERIYPPEHNALPAEVDEKGIRRDYQEARACAPHSTRAAATMARRALQGALNARGFKGRDLANQIDAAERDPDTTTNLLESFQILRSVGNFGAHATLDAEGNQLEVEPEELDALFLALDDVLDFYFVRRARRAAAIMALDKKLASAGKPAVTALVATRRRPTT